MKILLIALAETAPVAPATTRLVCLRLIVYCVTPLTVVCCTVRSPGPASVSLVLMSGVSAEKSLAEKVTLMSAAVLPIEPFGA